MISISLSAISPTIFGERSLQKIRENLEAVGERRLAGTRSDIEQLARDTYIRHIEDCQGDRDFDCRWIILGIDVRIWLRHDFNPEAVKEVKDDGEVIKGAMESQVRVYCREIDETFTLVYTHRSILINSEWLLGCHLA